MRMLPTHQPIFLAHLPQSPYLYNFDFGHSTFIVLNKSNSILFFKIEHQSSTINLPWYCKILVSRQPK
jgi:hypothetical protein